MTSRTDTARSENESQERAEKTFLKLENCDCVNELGVFLLHSFSPDRLLAFRIFGARGGNFDFEKLKFSCNKNLHTIQKSNIKSLGNSINLNEIQKIIFINFKLTSH